MTIPTRKNRAWLLPTAGLGGVLVIFAGVVSVGTIALRSRLREQALHQEASSLEGMVMFQLDAQAGDLNGADLAGTNASAFGAVLESSRLRGVIAVRLFDGNGQLLSCLPGTAVDAALSADLARKARDRGEACARLYPDAKLADHLGTEGLMAGDRRASLLEVIVPVPQASSGEGLPFAQYWMDGAPLEAGFTVMDRQLATQAALAFLAGSAAIVLCLAWVYRRLLAAERRLEGRTLDLARANAELVFAAKASAVGAVSAHLVHGLKNPVAGIDGFLADAAAGGETSGDGEALREARETTRRISELLREVSSMLIEEGSAPVSGPVRLSELMSLLRGDVADKADKAGVVLTFATEGEPEIEARTANLCRLALKNLVDNAIDATPRGRTVAVSARSAEDGSVEIGVADEGSGVDPSERERLFQPKRSGKPGGSGLGLAISWQLARHAGGDLSLARTDSTGSRFLLTFPTTPHPSS